MSNPLKLLAVLAHPDDESIGVGGTLARYAAEGVHVHLVCATRGERGRFFDHEDRPDDSEVGRVREGELRCAAAALGVGEVAFLDYIDGELAEAEQPEATGRIVGHIRRIRPQVVVTFDPFGAYGHPDHVAVSQLTTAAVAAAAAPSAGDRSHSVRKLYYSVLEEARVETHQRHFKSLGTTVDGERREVEAWPGWSVSARVDCEEHWEAVWEAVRCHRTQLAIFGRLQELTEEDHRALWGSQSFYRAMSLVNGGRGMEEDLFAGVM